jgi:hypothetical protein
MCGNETSLKVLFERPELRRDVKWTGRAQDSGGHLVTVTNILGPRGRGLLFVARTTTNCLALTCAILNIRFKLFSSENNVIVTKVKCYSSASLLGSRRL